MLRQCDWRLVVVFPSAGHLDFPIVSALLVSTMHQCLALFCAVPLEHVSVEVDCAWAMAKALSPFTLLALEA